MASQTPLPGITRKNGTDAFSSGYDKVRQFAVSHVDMVIIIVVIAVLLSVILAVLVVLLCYRQWRGKCLSNRNKQCGEYSPLSMDDDLALDFLSSAAEQQSQCLDKAVCLSSPPSIKTDQRQINSEPEEQEEKGGMRQLLRAFSSRKHIERSKSITAHSPTCLLDKTDDNYTRPRTSVLTSKPSSTSLSKPDIPRSHPALTRLPAFPVSARKTGGQAGSLSQLKPLTLGEQDSVATSERPFSPLATGIRVVPAKSKYCLVVDGEEPWQRQRTTSVQRVIKSPSTTADNPQVPASIAQTTGCLSKANASVKGSEVRKSCSNEQVNTNRNEVQLQSSDNSSPRKELNQVSLDIVTCQQSNAQPSIGSGPPDGWGRSAILPRSLHHSFARKLSHRKAVNGAELDSVGSIAFNLVFVLRSQSLEITKLRCSALPSKDGQAPDIFLKIRLLPEGKPSVQTRLIRGSIDPDFDGEEITFIGYPLSYIRDRTLSVQVRRYAFYRDDIIGECEYPLKEPACLTNLTSVWRSLELPKRHRTRSKAERSKE